VRDALRLTTADKVVMLLGTLTTYKGIDLLIRAFGDVIGRVPDAKLVCAGYPAADFDIAAHHALAHAVGIEHAVRLIPRYIESADLAAWVEASDVIALPYRIVFQSGAAMLGQTFGIPVVVANVGAMREMIGPDTTGLLVPPDDSDALADALVRLLQDDSARRRMGEAARAHARRSGDWNAIARRVLDHYTELLRPAAGAALRTQELSR
jgi:glycosyltransferase involved in cell wall biosynthesis